MTKNSVCCTPYLRNHTSYDCHLWCKCVKWYLQMFFSILKFWFSGFSGGWKGKKWPKMTKNSVCVTLYLRNCTSYDCDFWYTLVKWWYLQQISSFFKVLIFWSFYGGKKAKCDLKLPISVCFALYIRNCRSCHQDFDDGIYRCFSWFYFLLAHFNSFFNNYFAFQVHQ